MKYRKKDCIRPSGYVSYSIEFKTLFFWHKYRNFMSRNDRDSYFNVLTLPNKFSSHKITYENKKNTGFIYSVIIPKKT